MDKNKPQWLSETIGKIFYSHSAGTGNNGTSWLDLGAGTRAGKDECVTTIQLPLQAFQQEAWMQQTCSPIWVKLILGT